jgi:hypothetical protein
LHGIIHTSELNSFHPSIQKEQIIHHLLGVIVYVCAFILFSTYVFNVNCVLVAQITDYYWALLCMTVAIAATGFHNNAIIVNPQDLAPNHSGSVFGLMNTVGAVPGKIIWLLYNKHLF